MILPSFLVYFFLSRQKTQTQIPPRRFQRWDSSSFAAATEFDSSEYDDQEDKQESFSPLAPLFSNTEILPAFDASLFKAGAAIRRHAGGGSILIDVENVRGKSGFALSHSELIQGLVRWSRVCQFQGRLSLVVDHGSEPTALYLPDASMAVLFAGPTRKADDVIAQDVRFLGQELDVIVVTADGGIMDRCRRSAVQKGVHIVSPLHLLQDLELIAERCCPGGTNTEKGRS